jgi:hypothetical protein
VAGVARTTPRASRDVTVLTFEMVWEAEPPHAYDGVA